MSITNVEQVGKGESSHFHSNKCGNGVFGTSLCFFVRLIMRLVVFLLVFQTVYQEIRDLLAAFGANTSIFKDIEYDLFSEIYDNRSFEIDDAPKIYSKLMAQYYEGLSFSL